MQLSYFNSLVAALVLLGMVTAAPVPQEDDVSISADTDLLDVPILVNLDLYGV